MKQLPIVFLATFLVAAPAVVFADSAEHVHFLTRGKGATATHIEEGGGIRKIFFVCMSENLGQFGTGMPVESRGGIVIFRVWDTTTISDTLIYEVVSFFAIPEDETSHMSINRNLRDGQLEVFDLEVQNFAGGGLVTVTLDLDWFTNRATQITNLVNKPDNIGPGVLIRNSSSTSRESWADGYAEVGVHSMIIDGAEGELAHNREGFIMVTH